MTTAMAPPLRAAIPSPFAFLRRHSSPPPLPAKPPTATNSNPACASRRRLLPLASPRGLSSLAVEDASEVATTQSTGEGGGAERRGGLGALRSLFAPPSTSSVVKRAGEDGGGEAGGVRPGIARPRPRARPVRLADPGSSLGSARAGELLPEMSSLIRRLHEEGYLKNPAFLQELDSCGVDANGYARGVLATAAQSFGEDHQEIAKWLSGSSLKKVALSGCPCTERKTVFAAKRLRSFFCIQEDIVCRGCMMKKSCKFVNQNVNREGKLVLADVMRVLTAYAWDSVTSNPKLQKELHHSVVKSLKEVISLTA